MKHGDTVEVEVSGIGVLRNQRCTIRTQIEIVIKQESCYEIFS